MRLTRRKFFEGVGAGIVVLNLTACGGGDAGGSGPGFGAGCGATGGAISNNHTTAHTLAIAAADLDSMLNKTYNIQGAAGHGHDVTFTPAELQLLKGGTAIAKTSTVTDGGTVGGVHSHVVTVDCP